MFLSEAFILDVDEILVTQEVSSTVGLVSSSYLFGRIKLAGQLSDKYKIGGKVLYDPSKVTQVTFQGQSYFYVREPYIYFQINPTL